MSFETLVDTWTRLGEVDPLWAILTNKEAEGGRWDLEPFLASGRAEIDCILEEIHLLGFPLTFGKALDFGCGIGRLTHALAHHFEDSHGVDISPSMIDLANRLNEKPSHLHYHLNQAEDLSLFESDAFDFIYSRIVLQHMAPAYSKKYLAEFVRLIKPGGLAAFQVPAGVIPAQGTELDLIEEFLQPSGRFSASLTPKETALALEAGAQHHLTVRVQNTSRAAWIVEHPSGRRTAVTLGNHWLDQDRRVIQFDDGRTPLPVTLQPGETVQVGLTITAPQTPGRYWLELDLVEEMVAWFSDKGSQGAVIPVTVSGDVEKPAPEPKAGQKLNPSALLSRILKRLRGGRPPTADKPPFEMHGLPPTEIIQVIQENQGRLVAVQLDGSAGRDWRSYFYYVTK